VVVWGGGWFVGFVFSKLPLSFCLEGQVKVLGPGASRPIGAARVLSNGALIVFLALEARSHFVYGILRKMKREPRDNGNGTGTGEDVRQQEGLRSLPSLKAFDPFGRVRHLFERPRPNPAGGKKPALCQGGFRPVTCLPWGHLGTLNAASMQARKPPRVPT